MPETTSKITGERVDGETQAASDELGDRSLYELLGGREALQRALYGMSRD